jgi:hypothetical protein
MLDPALSSTVETSAPLWKVSGLDTFCAEIAPVTMIAFTSKQESFLCMADDLGCYLQHYEVAILSLSSFSQEVSCRNCETSARRSSPEQRRTPMPLDAAALLTQI